MALQEELELQGNWLFRYRSILPITILSIGVLVYIYTIHAPGTLFNKIEFYWHHYENLCLFISLAGIFIRVYTVGHTPAGTSGRTAESFPERYPRGSASASFRGRPGRGSSAYPEGS